jgi:hypothetical protein
MPKNTRRYFEELDEQLKGRAPGSPEFEALIRSKIGNQFKDLVSPETVAKSALIGAPDQNLYSPYGGMNYFEGTAPEKVRESLMNRVAGRGLNQQIESLPDEKRIFALGTRANPKVWSHEFRHERVNDEIPNRYYDLIYGSTSLPAYQTNVKGLYEALLDDSDDFKKLPYEEQMAMAYGVSPKDMESYIIDKLEKNDFAARVARKEDLPLSAALLSDIKLMFDGKGFLARNREANRTIRRTEDLPYEMIQLRSRLPFLNFVGKLDEPVKKAKGGSMSKDHGEFISKKLGKKRK